MSVRAFVAGQRVRGLLLRRRLAGELARDRTRALGLSALGVAFGALVFGVAYGGAWFAVRQNVPELVLTGTTAGLTGLAAALVFSSLGHAAQSFFSAKDLWLWESAPTGVVARFVDRFTETAMAALPPTLALGSVAIVGLQVGGGGGPGAALRGLLSVFIVAPVPVAVGVILAHLGGAILPAGRLRRLSLVLLGVALTAGLVWFRRMRVEKLLTEKGAAELLGAAKGVQSFGPDWLPPRQLATFVVEGRVDGLLVGMAGVAAAVGLALAAHAGLYLRARKLAVDESPTGVVRGSFGDRVLEVITRPVASDLRPLLQKDLLAFVRDPGQWGQVILLLGVGVLYVVNASALGEGLARLGDGGRVMLVAMHVGIVGFIAGGLAARFAFPQVGLEGQAVWIIDGAPIAWPRLLRAKWLAALPVTAFFPALLGLAGAVVLDFGPLRTLWTSAVIAVVAVLFAGLGVARGARQPLFDAASLSELAMGPGAISTVVQSTIFAGVFCGAAMITEGLAWGVGRGRLPASLGVVCAVVVLVGPALALWRMVGRAMKEGVAGLARRRETGGHAQGASRPMALESMD